MLYSFVYYAFVFLSGKGESDSESSDSGSDSDPEKDTNLSSALFMQVKYSTSTCSILTAIFKDHSVDNHCVLIRFLQDFQVSAQY